MARSWNYSDVAMHRKVGTAGGMRRTMGTKMFDALAASQEAYKNGYYAEKLEQGLQFQDVMTRELYLRGIVVVGYASRAYQIKHGENMLGAEIKRDGNFRETGNLYIEVAEKSHPDRPKYIPSGIHREDNSWLFVIGDEVTAWIFPINYLRKLQSRYHEVTLPTSIGFLMPVSEADKYCIRRIDITGSIT